MIKINLLPWREQLRQAKKINFIITIVAAIILAAIVVMLLHFMFRNHLNQQEERNAYLQTQIDEQSGKITTLNKKIKAQTAIKSDLDFLFNLREESNQSVELLDALARVIPESVALTRIMREGKTITLVGQAKSNLEITLLLENLVKAKIFQQANLTEISAKESEEGEERIFQIEGKMQG